MINAATLRLSLVLLLILPAARAQIPDQQSAIDEGIRRQAGRLRLRETLAQARDAQARRELAGAAKLYDACWDLILQIGPARIDNEIAETRAGLVAVRMELARAAQHRGNYEDAAKDVDDVLRADPTNPDALAFREYNNRLLEAEKGKRPSPEVQGFLPEIRQKQIQVGTLVQ